jgi:trehalose synthase
MSADLQPMAVARRAPGDYAPVAGARAVERLAGAAEPLRGARLAHVSVAGAHGSVPELLGGMLPLAAGSGLEIEWRVLFGGPEVRGVAAALQNGLQGAETAITDEEWQAYLEACARAGGALAERHDALVLHDPGALGLAAAFDGPVVWRCYLDASDPDPDALERVGELAAGCRLVLFTDESFAPPVLRDDRMRVAPPGIDPLDTRNLDLEPRLPGRVVRPLGVDLGRPFCLQVVPLDRWRDPHGTIDAFRLAKEEVPGLQLVLAGLLDTAATEDWQAAKEISDYAAGAEDVLLVTTYEGVGSLEVGALQRLARATLERSLREGFDLSPLEALWKRTPVVGDSSARLQVRDGVDGFIADDAAEFATAIVELVRDPGLAAEMGRAGRERVRERLLVTAALERELRALADALASATVQSS